jgi:addiction module HigA family antidote
VSKKLAPVHPGEVLAEDFMSPAGLTANQLALSLRIPANRITAIIAGKRGITADTALRLANGFEQSQWSVRIFLEASSEHHGSLYASTATFVATAHPRIAVISVGRHNTFGHRSYVPTNAVR